MDERENEKHFSVYNRKIGFHQICFKLFKWSLQVDCSILSVSVHYHHLYRKLHPLKLSGRCEIWICFFLSSHNGPVNLTILQPEERAACVQCHFQSASCKKTLTRGEYIQTYTVAERHQSELPPAFCTGLCKNKRNATCELFKYGTCGFRPIGYRCSARGHLLACLLRIPASPWLALIFQHWTTSPIT